MQARKYCKLTFENLAKMRIVLKRAKHFITCGGKFYGYDSPELVKGALTLDERGKNLEQLSMFSDGETATSALIGEL